MASRAVLLPRMSPLPAAAFRLLRPLAAAATLLPPAASLVQAAAARGAAVRCFATQPATSSLRDSSPNWSNRPPKETILLDGCDFEHWLVVMEPPPGDPSNPDVPRDEIIDSYIKTLAKAIGSEEEARMKIYSVSTRHYFAFGALVPEEVSFKLKELPKVRWVLPDSYLDVKNKDYGGEPFVNGEAAPYDPKYHEEWVRNNARANDRSRRNDRPRNFDRSRSFERRKENIQHFQNRDAPFGQAFNGPPAPAHNPGNMPPPPPGQHRGNMPPASPQSYANSQAAYTPGSAPPMENPQAGYTSGGAPHMSNTQPGYTPGGAPHMSNTQPGYTPGGAPHMSNTQPGYTPGVAPHMSNTQPGYTPGGAPHMSNTQPGYTPGGVPHMSNTQPGYTPGGAPHVSNTQAGYTPGSAPNYQQGGPSGYQGGPSGYQGGPGSNPGYGHPGGYNDSAQGGNNQK